MRLTEIAAAKQSCASPDATNEPDLSGLRLGPDQSNAVPKEGLEPSHPKAQEPKSCVSTSSTTPAVFIASLVLLPHSPSSLGAGRAWQPATSSSLRDGKASLVASHQHTPARDPYSSALTLESKDEGRV